jgi:hypothetical protein
VSHEAEPTAGERLSAVRLEALETDAHLRRGEEQGEG